MTALEKRLMSALIWERACKIALIRATSLHGVNISVFDHEQENAKKEVLSQFQPTKRKKRMFGTIKRQGNVK